MPDNVPAPTVQEVEAIIALDADPALRNLKITQGYHDLFPDHLLLYLGFKRFLHFPERQTGHRDWSELRKVQATFARDDQAVRRVFLAEIEKQEAAGSA